MTCVRNREEIDREVLLRAVKYDPVTGHFVWNDDPSRAPNVRARIAGRRAGYLHRQSGGLKYWRIKIMSVDYEAHTLAWIYANGAVPPNMYVRHKNGDGEDCRLDNLVLRTHCATLPT